MNGVLEDLRDSAPDLAKCRYLGKILRHYCPNPFKKKSVILLLLRGLPFLLCLYSFLLFCVHSIRQHTALMSLGVRILEVSRSHSNTTFGKTPLDEWSARRRDFNLTTHDTHRIQTSFLSARFEPAFPASAWPQTHDFERAAIGIGISAYWSTKFFNF